MCSLDSNWEFVGLAESFVCWDLNQPLAFLGYSCPNKKRRLGQMNSR